MNHLLCRYLRIDFKEILFKVPELPSESSTEKKKQDNSKPDSSQGSQSSKNKDKNDELEDTALELEKQMGVSHNDDEELKS